MIDLRCARMSLAFLAGVLLAGCASGGGGGGSVLPPPNPPPPPPPPAAAPIGPVTAPQAGVPSGTEFTANWGVGAVNAPTAWQRGFTGQGVKIGVLDDGIVATNDPAYAELDGRIEPASKDIDGARNQLSTTLSHGAELSSLIAGNFNGDKTVGVAYGASILAVRTDNGAGGFEYQALADALDYAVQQGVRIVNFSLGSPSSGGAAGVALREAIRRATTAGVIIVVSAGNDGAGAASVNYPGFYATDASVSNNLILVAGGMNQAAGGGSVYGDFNTVSNPAGAAASWYLTAPGWQIIVPDYGPTGPVPGFQTCGGALCVIQGTSYAAPHVAAAAALIMQASPGLTPAQVVQLLLASTDDIGMPGVDAQTGHGQLNIAKAFLPLGPLSAPVSGVGGEIAPGAPIGVVGAAFGDAFARPNAWSAVAFDSLGRTFAVSLAPSWLRAGDADPAAAAAPLLWRSRDEGGIAASFALAEAPPPAGARMLGETPQTAFRAEKKLGGGRAIAFARGVPAQAEDALAAAPGLLEFAGYDAGAALTQQLAGGARLSLVTQSGAEAIGDARIGADWGEARRRATSMRLDLVRGPFTFGGALGAGWEEGAVLGLSWNDRWGGQPRAGAQFAALSGAWRFARDWEAGFEAEAGVVRMGGGGWMSLAQDVTTSAGALALRWRTLPIAVARAAPDSVGYFTLSLAQPLRVESGAFSVLTATADEWGRQSLAYERRAIAAAPTGREIDATLSYALWAGDRLAARAAASYRSDPGHAAAAPPETAFTFGLRYGF